MAKKKKEKSFSSFLNNPIDFTLVITILFLLGIGLFFKTIAFCNFRIISNGIYIKNRL